MDRIRASELFVGPRGTILRPTSTMPVAMGQASLLEVRGQTVRCVDVSDPGATGIPFVDTRIPATSYGPQSLAVDLR